MKFSNIFNNYVTENNLRVEYYKPHQKQVSPVLLEQFLLEAKTAKKDLYKDLAVSDMQVSASAEDVASTIFYVLGKNIKNGKSPEETAKINNHQAKLYNEIIKKIKEVAINGNVTLLNVTSAAERVFTADTEKFSDRTGKKEKEPTGQNSATRGYNIRGLLSFLIDKKKILTPASGSVSGAAVMIDPEEDSENNTAPEETPPQSTDDTSSAEEPSKFDAAVQDNEPGDNNISSNSQDYFKVEKGTSITKEELKGGDRTLAAWLISIISQEIPGTFNKQSLTADARERDREVSAEEISSMIGRLVKMGKIKLVANSSKSEDQIYSRDDDESSASDRISDEPEDVVDRQLSGSTRKGFASKDYNFDF